MEKKYIVVGTGNLAVKIAEILVERKLNVAIYEKQLSQHSSVADLCAAKKIIYKRMTDDEMTTQLLEELQQYELQVISAINTYIFPKEIVKHPRFYGINYHNALLPYHQGMNAEAWAIYDMDQYTGITWHLIAEHVDKGEVIVQKKLELNSSMTAIKLLKMQLDLAYEAFLEFVETFIQGELLTKPQTGEGGKFHRLNAIPNNQYIDISWDIEKIYAFLRAMDYGILYTLGKPLIKIENEIYECGRYRITQMPEPAKQDMVVYQDNKIVINKENINKTIELLNVKQR